MVIRSTLLAKVLATLPAKLPAKLLAWSSVAALMILVGPSPFGSRTAAADPMSDSFATGGKRSSHKPASSKPASSKKKSGSGVSGGARKPASPAGKTKKPKISDDEFAAGAGSSPEAEPEPTPAPRREEPEERPRSRRSEDAEERAAPAESSGREESDADGDDRPKAKRAPAKKPAATKTDVRKGAKKKRGGDSDSSEEQPEGDGDGDDDDDDAAGAAFASLPSIAPRAVFVGLGAAFTGRSFQFAAPAQLQHESSFPRLGFVLDLEAFPLLLTSSHGWWQQIGLGGFYAAEPIGQASVADPNTGMSVNTPVKQSRWGIDLRMALPVGDRLVVTPRLGMQASSFTLSTKTPMTASSCTSTTTVACLPNTEVKLLTVGGVIRVAASSSLAFSLDGAYLVGLGVTNRPLNQIGYEISTSATGLSGELGASFRISDWLALRALLPITRISYKFIPTASTPAAVNYRSASELIWSIAVGAAVFTN